MGTTRRVIRWLILGRPNGLRATIRRQTGCMAWVDRPREAAAAAEAPPAAEVAAAIGPRPAFGASGSGSGVRLIPVDEVPPGTVVEVVAGDLALALANVDGELIAVDGACPHAGGPLGDGHLDGCTLTCPWHGWSYDLRTGRSLVASDVVLRRYPVRVVDGMVVLAEPAAASGAGAEL